MTSLKVVNAIACEYASVGANGKPILVHTYVGDILVREFPATFPLSFYLEFLSDTNEPIDLKVQVLQDKTVRADLQVEYTPQPHRTGLLMIPQIPLTFEQAGEVAVVASGDGIEEILAYKASVSRGPIPPG